MANFSGAVRIADLNDFIAPSQQCVVSLSGSKLSLKDELAVSARDREGGRCCVHRPPGLRCKNATQQRPVPPA